MQGRAIHPEGQPSKEEKTHIVITQDLNDKNHLAFMAYVCNCLDNEVWYMDGGTTDHMKDRSDWFFSLQNVPNGDWPVIIVDNKMHWVHNVGHINIHCNFDGTWES